jgi:ech hydrogenase subunit A
MGKLISNASANQKSHHIFHTDEEIPIFIQAVLTVLACFTFPIISQYALVPYLSGLFGGSPLVPIGTSDEQIMLIMLSMLLILPLSFIPLYKKDNRRIVPIYMAGENTGDNKSFNGALGARPAKLRNWYMEEYFGNGKLLYWSNLASIVAICVGVILLVRGLIV